MTMSTSETQIEKYLRALLYFQVRSAYGQIDDKPELFLARAGFTHSEIAILVGKTADAVSKTISRAKRGKGD
jgi:hypothetical protein